ncbi:hypothetical protein TNCV_626291 [Trichonephila clavipes]|nr:hypothetical protein TNCV_626291 [Trichonephila clavipes]
MEACLRLSWNCRLYTFQQCLQKYTHHKEEQQNLPLKFPGIVKPTPSDGTISSNQKSSDLEIVVSKKYYPKGNQACLRIQYPANDAKRSKKHQSSIMLKP